MIKVRTITIVRCIRVQIVDKDCMTMRRGMEMVVSIVERVISQGNNKKRHPIMDTLVKLYLDSSITIISYLIVRYLLNRLQRL